MKIMGGKKTNFSIMDTLGILLYTSDTTFNGGLLMTITHLDDAVRELTHISFEKTACRVSHSINAKLCVFTMPEK